MISNSKRKCMEDGSRDRLLGGNTKTLPKYAIVELGKPKLSRVKTSKEGEVQKRKIPGAEEQQKKS